MRVKSTGEIDYVGDVINDGPPREPRYVLMQDLGKPQIPAHTHDDLELIEAGEAWALAEDPNPRLD